MFLAYDAKMQFSSRRHYTVLTATAKSYRAGLYLLFSKNVSAFYNIRVHAVTLL